MMDAYDDAYQSNQNKQNTFTTKSTLPARLTCYSPHQGGVAFSQKKEQVVDVVRGRCRQRPPPPPPKSDRLQGACRAVTFPPRAGRLVDGSGAPPLVGPWQALRALSNLIQPSSAPQIERSIVRSEIPSITSATPAPHSSSVHMYGAIT